MKVLLTGATGFVGKALYQELLVRKYNLTCAFRKAHKNRLITVFGDCAPCFVDHVDKNTLWSPCLKDVDQVDASRLQTLMAWKPRVTVDQDIMATVQWCLADRRHAGKKKAQV